MKTIIISIISLYATFCFSQNNKSNVGSFKSPTVKNDSITNNSTPTYLNTPNKADSAYSAYPKSNKGSFQNNVRYTYQNSSNISNKGGFTVAGAFQPINASINYDDSGIRQCDICQGSGKVQDELICDECGGSGDFICGKCNGDKSEPCTFCTGTGKTLCVVCSGTGNIADLVNAAGSLISIAAGQTSTSQGTTYTPCLKCNGKGKIACKECNNGNVKCSRCGGMGHKECFKCDGKGLIRGRKKECPKCLGSGSISN